MYSNDSNCSRAASARGFMALFAIMLAMGLGLMAQPAGGGALRLCHERSRQQRFGDRHGPDAPVRGGHGPGGEFPQWDRRHSGWDKSLCRESELQHCFGDPHGHQHGGEDGPGGDYAQRCCRHPGRGTRLRLELWLQHCFGDRQARQHRGGHGRGGEFPPGGRRHP
jgi:hypothetical protein